MLVVVDRRWPSRALARAHGVQQAVAFAIAHLGLPSVIVIGLLVRLVLAPYTAWNNDVAVWFHTSLSGYYGVHLYDRPGFSYPPIWGYLLQVQGSLVRLAGFGPSFFGVQNPDFAPASAATADFTEFVTSPAFNTLFKSALFGFDLLSALLIYRLVDHLTGDAQRAKMSVMAWFLNPLVIYESAVQGAQDTLVGFAVLATVALVLSERQFWGGAAWVTGIMMKLSPVVLAFPLAISIAIGPGSQGRFNGYRSRLHRIRVGHLGAFAFGAVVAMAGLLAPEALFGSVPAMLHNVFARTSAEVTIGGLNLLSIRYLKPFSGLLDWALQNSSAVILGASIAQGVAVIAWSVWTAVMVRRDAVFGLLTGTVGTLASIMLLSPIANPQYVLWWLPALIVLVFVTGRGFPHLAVLSLAPLAFSLAILGPTASLAPLATYTGLLPATLVSNNAIDWYLAPGRLWGATLADDIFAPTSLATVLTLISMFVLWLRIAPARETHSAEVPT
jgi:hypothetical protein